MLIAALIQTLTLFLKFTFCHIILAFSFYMFKTGCKDKTFV